METNRKELLNELLNELLKRELMTIAEGVLFLMGRGVNRATAKTLIRTLIDRGEVKTDRHFHLILPNP